MTEKPIEELRQMKENFKKNLDRGFEETEDKEEFLIELLDKIYGDNDDS